MSLLPPTPRGASSIDDGVNSNPDHSLLSRAGLASNGVQDDLTLWVYVVVDEANVSTIVELETSFEIQLSAKPPTFALLRADVDAFFDHVHQRFLALEGSASHETSFRKRVYKLLIQLSRGFNKLPNSLFAHHVQLLSREPVAGGGYADIFRGTLNGNDVALKCIRLFVAQLTPDRLCRETFTWQSLNHPHILCFLGLDCETFSHRFCMVSPWMPNGNLLQFITKQDAQSPQIIQLLHESAQGLQYLHMKSMVHGDLRCANILINSEGQVQLADFGLSLLLSTTQTTGTPTGGSIRWSAPEIFLVESPQNSTTMTDVYSFGCVCLEAYTRKPPFSNLTNDGAVIRTLMNYQMPTAVLDKHDIPLLIFSLVETCLDRRSLARPQADKICETLAHALHEPEDLILRWDQLTTLPGGFLDHSDRGELSSVHHNLSDAEGTRPSPSELYSREHPPRPLDGAFSALSRRSADHGRRLLDGSKTTAHLDGSKTTVHSSSLPSEPSHEHYLYDPFAIPYGEHATFSMLSWAHSVIEHRERLWKGALLTLVELHRHPHGYERLIVYVHWRDEPGKSLFLYAERKEQQSPVLHAGLMVSSSDIITVCAMRSVMPGYDLTGSLCFTTENGPSVLRLACLLQSSHRQFPPYYSSVARSYLFARTVFYALWLAATKDGSRPEHTLPHKLVKHMPSSLGLEASARQISASADVQYRAIILHEHKSSRASLDSRSCCTHISGLDLSESTQPDMFSFDEELLATHEDHRGNLHVPSGEEQTLSEVEEEFMFPSRSSTFDNGQHVKRRQQPEPHDKIFVCGNPDSTHFYGIQAEACEGYTTKLSYPWPWGHI